MPHAAEAGTDARPSHAMRSRSARWARVRHKKGEKRRTNGVLPAGNGGGLQQRKLVVACSVAA